MRQSALNRAVAHATGEAVTCIKALGFGLLVVPARAPRRPRPAGAQAVCPAAPERREEPLCRPA
jgi:hypothetical protein